MNPATGIRAERPSLVGYLRSVLDEQALSRVLVVSFNQWDFTLNAVAEIAATLHDMGHEPMVALWADDTPVHDVGWSTNQVLARLLASPSRDRRLERGLKSLGLPDAAFPRPPIRNWRPTAPLPTAPGRYRSAIRDLSYRGAPLGRAILQVHPDTNTPVTDEHLWPQSWLRACTESFAWAYDQVAQLIEERGVTAVAVFNGRFLHDSAGAAAADAAGLPVLAYDFGGNDTDFDVTIDATHDWSALQRRMLTMYENWPAEEREALGSRWFEERRQHVDPRNHVFTDTQTIGAGIEKPEGRPLVVYFSSSGDEISELDLDWSEYFFGQPPALQCLAEVCRELGYTLLVRTHPHKRLKPKRDVEEWHAAVRDARPDIHLDEWSDVDSYTLMVQADAVVTYGSTTGVEAAYAKCPVIVMGPSAYDELGCATRVVDEDGLRRALLEMQPGRWPGALAYGLMMLRRGFTNRYLVRDGDALRLGGVELRDSRPVVLKLSHLLGRVQRRRLTTD